MKTILNFREINGVNKEGKSIKEKTIFRCGSTDVLSKEDKAFLSNTLGINNIYDFRNQNEIINDLQDCREFDVCKIKILKDQDPNDFGKVVNADKEQIENSMNQIYRDFAHSDGYSSFLKAILKQENINFLFHCTAGKDRTGIAGVIIMKILDFDNDEIIKEYLKIDQQLITYLKEKMSENFNLGDEMENKFEPFLTVKESFINSYLDEVNKHYGSFDEYLENKLEVTKEEKEIFKRKYLNE